MGATHGRVVTLNPNMVSECKIFSKIILINCDLFPWSRSQSPITRVDCFKKNLLNFLYYIRVDNLTYTNPNHNPNYA